MDLHLSISNGFVSSKIYEARDDVYFDIVNNFPFLDGDVPHSTSYVVYISQLIWFARVSSHELVSKFNVRLKTLLHQGLSEPEFYGDLVYKFKNIVGRADFSDQFKKISYVTIVLDIT